MVSTWRSTVDKLDNGCYDNSLGDNWLILTPFLDVLNVLLGVLERLTGLLLVGVQEVGSRALARLQRMRPGS